jgi:hypothetical protein
MEENIAVNMDTKLSIQTSSETPNIYMIRHAEKPDDNEDNQGKLSPKGQLRAKYLPVIFGKDSNYNIHHIMAQAPLSGTYEVSSGKRVYVANEILDGSRARCLRTVTPLADHLGLKVCFKDRDDVSGAAKEAIRRTKDGDVLICWEHARLQLIARALGAENSPEYPEDHFDLIWVIPEPFDKLTDIRGQHVPCLDDPKESNKL